MHSRVIPPRFGLRGRTRFPCTDRVSTWSTKFHRLWPLWVFQAYIRLAMTIVYTTTQKADAKAKAFAAYPERIVSAKPPKPGKATAAIAEKPRAHLRPSPGSAS